MAHFARIDSNNEVVQVLVVPDAQEHRGAEFLTDDCNLPGTWIQTSYTGRIRKRFASVGMTYDADRDAFIFPKAHDSWVFDEDSCAWRAPVAYPTDGGIYAWDEESISWQKIEWIQPPNLVLPEPSDTDAADLSHSDE